MAPLKIIICLIGTLQVTGYQSVPAQTDDSPTWTSIGDRTTMFGCAISQDLLETKRVKYGDILYIEGHGYRVVNDCMGRFAHYKVPRKGGTAHIFKRQLMSIDLFCRTHAEEHRIQIQHKKVFKILLPIKGDQYVK